MIRTANMILISLVLSISVLSEHGYAGESPLQFGQFQKQSERQNLRRATGPSFSYEEAIALVNENDTFVFYNTGGLKSTLSIFEDGTEHVLLKVEMGTFASAFVPSPILARGQLNANTIPDLFFSYAIDRGVSNSSEVYEQHLVLFVDGHREVPPSIPLSAADWYLRDEEPRYRLASNGTHAGWKRESLVMLSPATSHTACTISVWSKVETFPHPPTHTPASIVFQVEIYQLQDMQFLKTDETTGTHANTVTFLQTLIATKRAQGEEPMFLDMADWRSPQKTEDEWFSWWGTPTETVP